MRSARSVSACSFWISTQSTIAPFLTASPAKRAQLLADLKVGYGDLNATHMALCLSYCGYETTSDSAGTNGALACRWLCPAAPEAASVADLVSLAHARVETILQTHCPGAPALASGEMQAALCIFVYSLQTFFTGSNKLHPRAFVGQVARKAASADVGAAVLGGG